MISSISRRLEAKRRTAGEGGFTLIELLVVIVILGVLSAVVVFAVGGVKDKGDNAAKNTEVQILRTAQEAYYAKNGSYAPDSAALYAGGFLASPSKIYDTRPSVDPVSGRASFAITCTPGVSPCGGEGTDTVPVGGTLKVPGTNVVGNVTGNNFVNPAVTSSGTSHPNVEYMFNGLLRWAGDNTAQPDLAQSYTLSPDQQTATFVLRPGMVWHNNTPILATDVKFTFEKALLKYHSRTGPSMTPALGGTGGGTTSLSLPAGAITTSSGPETVVFHFVYGYPTLLRQMNVTEAPILPQNVYGPCDDTGTNNINTSGCPANNPTSDVDFPADTATNKSPVGSGPFRFQRRDTVGATPARLVFIRRSLPGGVGATPYHRAGLPLADTLIQVPTADTGNSLNNGAIDVGTPANNRILPIVSPQTSADITAANGYTLADVPRGSGGGNCITTFSFHLWQYGTTTNSIGALAPDAPYTHEIFGDPTPVDPDGPGPAPTMARGKAVRRAISMAIDRTSLFNSLDFGKGRVPDSPYHSKLPPYQAQSAMPAYDTATAATWLDNAGWPVSGSPAIRRANFTTTMPGGTVVPGTPLAWQMRRVTGGQDNFYQGMKTQLAAAPVSINVAAGTGNHAEVAADGSTNTTGALVAGARNFDMMAVSYCNGDDPVVGVRRQYHSDGIPASGAPSNFTNPAGVRSTVMDGLWNTAFGANYTTKHQQIQAMSADDAYQIYWDETTTTRAWKSSRCAGFNNFNTGLYVETGNCG